VTDTLIIAVAQVLCVLVGALAYSHRRTVDASAKAADEYRRQEVRAYQDARGDVELERSAVIRNAQTIAQQSTLIAQLTRDVAEVSERERACTERAGEQEKRITHQDALIDQLRAELADLRRVLSTERGVPT
jgi:vacuolar-type H+-ATPase subunit I/STV1